MHVQSNYLYSLCKSQLIYCIRSDNLCLLRFIQLKMELAVEEKEGVEENTDTLKQCLVKNISLFHHFNMKKESQQLVNLKNPVLRCICLKRMFCMKYNTILFILQYKNKPGSKTITVLTSILELFCYRHLVSYILKSVCCKTVIHYYSIKK